MHRIGKVPGRRALGARAGLVAAALLGTGRAQAVAESGPDLEALGQELAEVLDAGDAERLRSHLDTQALLERALQLSERTPEFARRFREGFAKGRGLAGYVTAMVAPCDTSKRTRFLRVRTVRGEPRLLFRGHCAEGAGFFELVLCVQGSRARVCDADGWLRGPYSEEIARYDPAQAPGPIARMFGLSRHNMLSAPATKFRTQVDSGDHRAVLAAYRALPPSLQNERIVLADAVASAAALGDVDGHLALLDAFAASAASDEPARDWIALDAHILRADWGAAIAAIHRLEGVVGAEGSLPALRADCLIEKGDFAAARAAAAEGVTAEPGYFDAHVVHIEAALLAGDHAATLRALRSYIDHFHTDQGWLESLKGYAAFAATPQAAQWNDRRARETFGQDFCAVLEGLAPGIQAILQGELHVEMEWDERESTFHLCNAYAKAVANPGQRQEILEYTARAGLEDLKPQDGGLDNLVPLLRHRDYVAAQHAYVREHGADAGQATYFEPWAGDLVVLYAIDGKRSLHVLSRRQVTDLGLTPQELRAAAVQKLESRVTSLLVHNEPVRTVVFDEQSEASLLLVDGLWDLLFLPFEEPAVAVPARDVLLVADRNDPDAVAQLRAEAAKSESMPNSVSEQLFVRRDGAWVVLEP
ncbi:MAG: hypothetical protein AAF628_09900 [Planctomycetota bacterium]